VSFLTGVDTTGELAQDVVDIERNKIQGPRRVKWEDGVPHPVIDVGLGKQHLLVVARHDNMETKVYGSGANGSGQLGLGDSMGCKVLAHVCCGNVVNFCW
jgi:alpha-tubulin suppressor-like RCC1 family protein